MARHIKVSARLISWPKICACCGRSSETELEASFTRTSGKKVIKHDRRSWGVPYCHACALHVNLSVIGRALGSFGVVVTLVIAIAVGILHENGKGPSVSGWEIFIYGGSGSVGIMVIFAVLASIRRGASCCSTEHAVR